MSVEFDTPANRIIASFKPKSQFGIDTSSPDIAFLRALSIQGRMRYFNGIGTGVSTIVSFTPTTGETFFFLRGEVSTGSANPTFRVENDGNERLTGIIGTDFNAGHRDINIGIDSLVGDGMKTYSILNLTAVVTVRAVMVGWVENTTRIRDVTT